MKLRDLFVGLEIEKTNLETLDIIVTDIETDSRRVREGVAFICLIGEHSDGHDYIVSARESGASVIIAQTESELLLSGPYVLVKSTRRADSFMHDNLFENPTKDMSIIAVTGTNGKTSVTHMLKAIFDSAGEKTGLVGTIKNIIGTEEITSEMTTPNPRELYGLFAKMREAEVRYVFMEASSHALEYEKLAPVTPEIGIFTNLTPEHLDFHGTMENYAAAKAKLFAMSRRNIINADDEWGSFMYEHAAGEKMYYSANGNTPFVAQNIVNHKTDGVEYYLVSDNDAVHVRCMIPGSFTVYNTLCAAAAGILCGISGSQIAIALRSLSGVAGRMERVILDEADISVFVDYAHTPDALENVLNSVRSFKTPDERLTVVFGCGGDRDKVKRPVMGKIATTLADNVIITSDNSRTEDPNAIINDILVGVLPNSSYTTIVGRVDAINYAIKNAQSGEIILVTGKGHEDYEINATGKHAFSEKQVIRDAFAKYRSE